MISWPNPTSRTGIASAAWLPKLGCYFNVLTGTSSRSHCETIFKILLQFNSKEMNEFIWKHHTNVTHHWEPLFPHKLSTQLKHKMSQFWNNFGFFLTNLYYMIWVLIALIHQITLAFCTSYEIFPTCYLFICPPETCSY